MSETPARGSDRRRAQREALNKALFLDAAEALFAEAGYEGASLRTIAKEAGFSTAAMYLFFETKAHLFAEVMLRRTDQLLAEMTAAADTPAQAIERLAAMADAVIDCYQTYPDFGRLVCRLYQAVPGSSLSELDATGHEVAEVYSQFINLEARVISDGQRDGHIRDGDSSALAYLFTGLVNSCYAASLVAPTMIDPGRLHAILAAALGR